MGKQNFDTKHQDESLQVCVLSMLLYDSETSTTYAKQETKLNVFHMRSLRKNLGITWENKFTNSEVLIKAKLSTIFAMLIVRRLHWLGHVHRMEKGCIFQRTFCMDSWNVVLVPEERYRDSCKRNLQSAYININTWEDIASQRSTWLLTVKSGVNRAEKDRSENGPPNNRRGRHQSYHPTIFSSLTPAQKAATPG